MHFGHILLTDGRTFIIISGWDAGRGTPRPSNLSISRRARHASPLRSPYLSYTAPRPITLGKLDAHPVTGQQPDEVGAEPVGDMGEDPGPILELDPEHAIRERLDDPTIDKARLGHER